MCDQTDIGPITGLAPVDYSNFDHERFIHVKFFFLLSFLAEVLSLRISSSLAHSINDFLKCRTSYCSDLKENRRPLFLRCICMHRGECVCAGPLGYSIAGISLQARIQKFLKENVC